MGWDGGFCGWEEGREREGGMWVGLCGGGSVVVGGMMFDFGGPGGVLFGSWIGVWAAWLDGIQPESSRPGI